jgi:hypothetical protein
MERAMFNFKSPLLKLLKFFQKSRNGWKAKCQQATAKGKHWANQARAVEKSRNAWRQKAQTAKREVRELRQELEALKNTAA